MEIQIKEPRQVISARVTFEILLEVLGQTDPLDQDKENFWAIGLNSKNFIQYIELVHLGTVNSCHYHPREIFRKACIKGIVSLIIAHNHPSGNPSPSMEDREVTFRIKKSGDILGINLLDHVIVGKETFYSFRDEGTFWIK